MSSDPTQPPAPTTATLPPPQAAATVAIESAAPSASSPGSPESHLSLIGRQLGPYHLKAELGAGGMGAVYLAEQFEPMRRQVALKVIKAGMDSGEVLARFQAEREMLARMTHPNIAQVLDVGATPEGRLYFAMEYVPGVPLNEFCDQRGVSIAQRLELFLQVCDGVQHAHQKGVIHRDLKPGNLLVADYQGRLLVKVIDFGIAKSMGAQNNAGDGSTSMGMVIGTPAYMSPEQAAGDVAAIDTRTDVYSLGVLMYVLITHELPISGDTIARAGGHDLARVLREAQIRPPSRKVQESARTGQTTQSELKRVMSTSTQTLARALKGDLDWIALKALERERELRYASVSELAADLRRYVRGEAVLAGPPGKLYRIRKFVARNKLVVGAAAAVVLSLILGIVGTSYMTIEARRQRELAEAAQHRAEAESARAIAARGFIEDMIAAPDPWKLSGGSAETRNVRVADALDAAAANLAQHLAANAELRGEVATMLGRTLRRLGKLEASRKQLDLAVLDLEKARPELDAARVGAELERAMTLAEQGEDEAARAVFDRLLPKLPQVEGLPSATVDEARRTAASTLAALGEGDAAEKLARDNLQRASAVSGEFSTPASGAKAALSEVLTERGAWDEAEKLVIDAYTTERQRLGVKHPMVLQLLSNAAALSFRHGDYALAEQRFREVALGSEEVLGRDHPETLRSWAQVANALSNAGKSEDAVALFQPLIEKRELLLGADHPDVLMMRYNLAAALRATGKLDEAEATLDDVYQRRRKALGETHPDTLSAINMVGLIALQRHDNARAEVLFRQASELFQKARGANHPDTVMIQANHLVAIRNLGRFDEAIVGFAALSERAEQVLPPGHFFLAVIRNNYGLALMEKQRYDEAEPLMLSSHEMLLKQFGADDARTRIFRSRLADLYTRWKKPELAARYKP